MLRAKHILHASLVAASVLMASCATDISEQHQYSPLINGAQKSPVAPENPPSYIKLSQPDREVQARRVSVNAPETSLAELFATTLPDVSFEPQDVGVDIRKAYSVSVNDMALPDFLEYMSARTGYDIQLAPGNRPHITAASVAHRTWNLAALSTLRKSSTKVGKAGDDNSGGSNSQMQANAQGGSSGGTGSQARRSTEIKITQDEDEWNNTIRQLRSMLQADGENKQSTVVAIRSIGLVEASGPPKLIRQADNWLQTVKRYAGRTVHLGLAMHEVTLKDSKSTGISWNLLADGQWSGGTRTSTTEITGTFPAAANIQNAGALTISQLFTIKDDALSLLLNFLAQFGKVTLLTQPNLTVVNGQPASLSSGEEFSYVESVITNTTSQGTTTVTPVLSRILVGVEFSITPKILDDDRILIDVVPVVSTLQAFNDFEVGDSKFQTPRIAINELATQVIVKSGQTVHIGGLITDRMQETINRLPFKEKSFADYLFRSEANSLERRELVLTITPRII